MVEQGMAGNLRACERGYVPKADGQVARVHAIHRRVFLHAMEMLMTTGQHSKSLYGGKKGV